MDKKKLMEKDLYELLEIQQDADLQAIKKAYRKKALTCHPDKNPDNPQAAAMFLELSAALEILIEEESRASYNALYNKRKFIARRHAMIDARRKKFKEDLEAREKAAAEEKERQYTYDDMVDEIARLRREGSNTLIEEMESVQKEVLVRERQIADELRNVPTNGYPFNLFGDLSDSNSAPAKSKKLKVKWKAPETDKTNGGYNEENLWSMFAKHGIVEMLVVSSKKKGRAIVEYQTAYEADIALNCERGFLTNPLKLTLIECEVAEPTTSYFQPILTHIDVSKYNDEEFEKTVMAKMKEAEKAKKRKVENTDE